MPGRPASSALGYRPALDGLRAVAVLAVLGHHAGWMPGGWLGVDVFFTLSGFLITALLCEEHTRTGTLAIGHFYVRRALRLLPALVVFLLIWGALALATIPSEFWPILGGYLLGVLGYAANWLIIYWRPLGMFGHTWSLAIEEQFYLVWPVLFWLLLRWVRHSTWIIAGLVTAAAGSLAWRLALAWAGEASLSRIYMGTDTHADGLLLGAALAMWFHYRAHEVVPGPWSRTRGAVAPLGLVGLLLAAPWIPGYVWGMTTLAALASGGVILAVVAGGSGATRWLESRCLVGIGRISYGAYLWHYAVFFQCGVLWGPGESAAPVWRTALAWGFTFAAAALSYVLIERPVLAYKAVWSSPSSPPQRARLRDRGLHVQPLPSLKGTDLH